MRIGAVGSANSISNSYSMQAARVRHTQHTQRTQSADITSKKLQNEITDKERQKSSLSSNANISSEQKTTRNIELQQGISSLKAQLRRYEIESGSEKNNIPEDDRSSSVREELAKEAEAKAAKAEELKKAEEERAARKEKIAEEADSFEKTNQDMQSVIASGTAADQIGEKNSVIAKTEAGIVIQKGELRQDGIRGANTDKKQDEISSREKRMRLLSDITLGPKGINNASGSMKVSSATNKQSNDQNIIHSGIDGTVFLKTG